ncbi:hypothetical protein [Streptomyces sp. NPDC054797]
MAATVDHVTAESAPCSPAGWNRLGDRLFAQALAVIDNPRHTGEDLAAAEARLAAARAAWKRAQTASV